MVVLALAAMPLTAQEPEPTTEEQEIEKAIEEALGNTEESVESVPLSEIEGEMQEAPPQDEWEGESDPPQKSKSQYREVQTLMSGGGGGYGALSFGYTQIDGVDAFQMGARAAWIIGHGFGLGIAGEGFTSDMTPMNNDYWAMSGGYGGLLMEPIILGWLPVHLALPVVVGGGGMASYATGASDPWDSWDPTYSEYSVFFVIEAGAEIEFNLTRFFRLTLFGNYRWTTDLDMKPMHGLAPNPLAYPVGPDALHGWTAGARFKFGSF